MQKDTLRQNGHADAKRYEIVLTSGVLQRGVRFLLSSGRLDGDPPQEAVEELVRDLLREMCR